MASQSVGGVKLGLGLPHAGPLASPANILRAASEAERIGLDSLWVLDRVLRPLAPEWGDPPPPFYATVFDPLETLTFVAAHTTRVQLGSSVIQALLHPPVVLARRLATLDQLSGGRLIAGLGQGWMPEEFAAAGVPPTRRGKGMVEFIEAIRAVWGPDPVSFDGEIYRIPASDIGPKPTRGRIPVVMGYDSKEGLRIAARFADGLNPNRRTLKTLRRDLEFFRNVAEEAGRDPSALPIYLRGAGRLDSDTTQGEERPLFAGSIDQWVVDIERVATMGVGHVFLQLHTPIEEQIATIGELRTRLGPGPDPLMTTVP